VAGLLPSGRKAANSARHVQISVRARQDNLVPARHDARGISAG